MIKELEDFESISTRLVIFSFQCAEEDCIV